MNESSDECVIIDLAEFKRRKLAAQKEEEMLRIKRSTGAPVRYILKNDRDSENPTVFLFRRLEPAEEASIEDDLLGVDSDGNTVIRHSTGRRKATLRRLCGWENLVELDEDGRETPVRFSEKTKRVIYDMLPAEVRKELQDEFGQLSMLGQASDQDAE